MEAKTLSSTLDDFSMEDFFLVVVNPQTYLNILYLLVSFPLGIFYFVFLVVGLTVGLSLVIIWVGLLILPLVMAGSWLLGSMERWMAVVWLKEDIGPMRPANPEGLDVWGQLKQHSRNPVTWKILVYLFAKFPLGIASFVAVVVSMSVTLAFIVSPFWFLLFGFDYAGLNYDVDYYPWWEINSVSDAFLLSIVGLVLFLVALHTLNIFAWFHKKFARVMLSNEYV